MHFCLLSDVNVIFTDFLSLALDIAISGICTSSLGVDMVVKGERIDVDVMPSPVKVCSFELYIYTCMYVLFMATLPLWGQ